MANYDALVVADDATATVHAVVQDGPQRALCGVTSTAGWQVPVAGETVTCGRCQAAASRLVSSAVRVA